MAQVVDCLPGKYKALSSSHSTQNKEEEESIKFHPILVFYKKKK
jgi:hypothetical protein